MAKRLRRCTCRDPRKDTLKLLRQEIDELLFARERMLNGQALWQARYSRLRARFQAYTEAIRAVGALDEVHPFEDENDL